MCWGLRAFMCDGHCYRFEFRMISNTSVVDRMKQLWAGAVDTLITYIVFVLKNT